MGSPLLWHDLMARLNQGRLDLSTLQSSLHTDRCPVRPSENDRLFSQQTHDQRPSLYPSGSVIQQFLMDISVDSATLGQLEKHAVVGRPNGANGMRAWVQKLEATQEHSVEDIIDNDSQLPGLQHSSGARNMVIGSNSLDALKTQQIETHRGAGYDQRSTKERSVPRTERPLRRRSGRHDLHNSFNKEDTYDQDRWIDTQMLAGSSLENIAQRYAANFLILQGLMLFPMEYSVDSGFMMDSNGQHSVYRGVRRMAVFPTRDLQESVLLFATRPVEGLANRPFTVDGHFSDYHHDLYVFFTVTTVTFPSVTSHRVSAHLTDFRRHDDSALPTLTSLCGSGRVGRGFPLSTGEVPCLFTLHQTVAFSMANSPVIALPLSIDGLELDWDRLPTDDSVLKAIRDSLVDKLAFICPLTEIDNLTTRLRFCTKLREAILQPPRALTPSSKAPTLSKEAKIEESMEASFFARHGTYGLTAIRVASTGNSGRRLREQWGRLRHRDREAILRFLPIVKPSPAFLTFESKISGNLSQLNSAVWRSQSQGLSLQNSIAPEMIPTPVSSVSGLRHSVSELYVPAAQNLQNRHGSFIAVRGANPCEPVQSNSLNHNQSTWTGNAQSFVDFTYRPERNVHDRGERKALLAKSLIYADFCIVFDFKCGMKQKVSQLLKGSLCTLKRSPI
ncbi:hypothetical protein Purlil1_13338 [Purpureocillium lilacinum]|uniref:Uncharacterized protein n=1 Tax=Purpureocillium lilacinum TaxID=33203 RepID=A0ABR0BEA5_PURLI|nr:hypothetical protein Purlil1_13338 [Purpureocillium lilacinum]